MYFLVNCISNEFLKILEFIFKLVGIVFFLVPIILILMLTIDIFKAVISNNADEMKKHQKLAIRRIIMCIVLFLVGTIVNLSMSIIEDMPNYEECIEKATKGDFDHTPTKSTTNNTTSNQTNNNQTQTNTKTKKAATTKTKHNILIVGNSRTYRTPSSLADTRVAIIFTKMLKNEGIISSSKLKKKKLTNGGYLNRNDEITIVTRNAKTLKYLATTSKFKKYMKDKKYDIVILQEKGSTSKSDYDTYVSGATKIANLQKNKNAKIYIRSLYPSTNQGKSTLNKLNKNANKVANKLSSKGFATSIIHDGNAIIDARDSYKVYDASDGYHPNNKGAYIAAACTYKEVFGKKASDLKYKKSIYNDDYNIDKSTFKKLNKIVDQNC